MTTIARRARNAAIVTGILAGLGALPAQAEDPVADNVYGQGSLGWGCVWSGPLGKSPCGEIRGPYSGQGFFKLACSLNGKSLYRCTPQVTVSFQVDEKTRRKLKLPSTTLTTGRSAPCSHDSSSNYCVVLPIFSSKVRQSLDRWARQHCDYTGECTPKRPKIKTTEVVVITSPFHKTYRMTHWLGPKGGDEDRYGNANFGTKPTGPPKLVDYDVRLELSYRNGPPPDPNGIRYPSEACVKVITDPAQPGKTAQVSVTDEDGYGSPDRVNVAIGQDGTGFARVGGQTPDSTWKVTVTMDGLGVAEGEIHASSGQQGSCPPA
jgi:hypothetical protein